MLWPRMQLLKMSITKTKDTINKDNCILNNKNYPTNQCNQIFWKLKLDKGKQKTNTKHQYITIQQNDLIKYEK